MVKRLWNASRLARKWQVERAKGISASNVGAILRLARYGTPGSVYMYNRRITNLMSVLAKRNPTRKEEDWNELEIRDAMNNFIEEESFPSKLGRMREADVGLIYERDSLVIDPTKMRVDPGTMWTHPDEKLYPFLAATPDREIYDINTNQLVKISEFKAPMAPCPEIRDEYWWQTQIQMACTGARVCDFEAVFFPTKRSRIKVPMRFLAQVSYCEEAMLWCLPVLTKYHTTQLALHEEFLPPGVILTAPGEPPLEPEDPEVELAFLQNNKDFTFWDPEKYSVVKEYESLLEKEKNDKTKFKFEEWKKTSVKVVRPLEAFQPEAAMLGDNKPPKPIKVSPPSSVVDVNKDT